MYNFDHWPLWMIFNTTGYVSLRHRTILFLNRPTGYRTNSEDDKSRVLFIGMLVICKTVNHTHIALKFIIYVWTGGHKTSENPV